MDPSIMKLLEDDEDESMHSGADVEAFKEALNRDIAIVGDASPISQPSESAPGVLSQGSSTTSIELYGHWQNPSQEKKLAMQIQQQKELQHLSPVKPIQHQQIDDEPDCRNLQQEKSHSGQQRRLAETSPLQFVDENQTEISEQNPIPCPIQKPALLSESQEQHMVKQLNSQQAISASLANNTLEQTNPKTPVEIPILMQILCPYLEKDKSMQFQAVYAKLTNNEITSDYFLRFCENIVGNQMFSQAAHRAQIQLQLQARPPQQTNQKENSIETHTASQRLPSHCSQGFVELQKFSSSSDQKDHQSVPHQFRVPSVAVQTLSDTRFSTTDNSDQKSTEISSKFDGKGDIAVQTASICTNTVSMISLEAVNRQRQHPQLPRVCFPTNGSTIGIVQAHKHSGLSVSATTISPKSQTHDSKMRQATVTQGMLSTQLEGNQSMNIVSVPKYDLQNASNETKRLNGGSICHVATQSGLQKTQVARSAKMPNKELGNSTVPLMSCVKQVVDQVDEPLQKLRFTAPQGSSFGSGNTIPESMKDKTFESKPVRIGSSTSTSTMTVSQISGSVATQVDLLKQNQMWSKSSSTTSPLLAGTIITTPPKAIIGQKKPLNGLDISPPQASKKQKTSGDFHDQTVEQLNDVTAVSGVNLREEEEQLLSVPKEESRVSEATRRVVQEEEERLILQKRPLQKKLAEITSKCGIESISSNVERCLSLCVEERLRGLIRNLIRLSEQRNDTEKTRYRFVVTSDVRRQILAMNQKAKEDWEKKQAEEAEKLRKLDEMEGSKGLDAAKYKDEGRSKAHKINKEEEDKMRTTAANVAARAAVGGDDMLSKWQLMAEQARQRHDGRLDGPSCSQPGRTSSNKPAGKRGFSAASMPGGMRKLGRSSVMTTHSKVARRISTKDVTAVLEREPQMSRSALIYRLYDRMPSDSAAG